MSSSTSAFDRVAIVTFVCVFAALVVPYECAVRASERLYGVRRANIVMPRTLSPKIDGFMSDVGSGIRYAAYAVGTSRMEWGVRPEFLDRVLGPTYNFGLGGISSIVSLELFQRIGLRPQRILVSVSPFDFTKVSIAQGNRGVSLATFPARAAHAEHRGPTAWTRVLFRSLLHASSRERRRNIGQWLELIRDRGKLLAFLNNEDATGPLTTATLRGYRLSNDIASPEVFAFARRPDVFAEYQQERPQHFRRMQRDVEFFKAARAEVVLVRVPTGIAVRRSEDSITTFDADMRALARACGVRYIDGSMIVDKRFPFDRRNFADAEHLNAAGAEAFSRTLAAALEQRDIVAPTHHQ